AHALARDHVAVRHLDHRPAAPGVRDHRRRGLELGRVFAGEDGHNARQRESGFGVQTQNLGVRAVRAQKTRVKLAREIPVRGVPAAAGEKPVVLATTLEFGHAGCGQDCQAANFQPCGVRTHALRKSSRSERGWPPISASIAAFPRMSAVSPKKRTWRSLQLALLYFTLPDFIESSQLAFVSVTPDECV